MKKFLACACAAALMLGAVQTPHTTAYAITVIDDAQTACEKNMERFLDLLEKADVDVNFTKEDMETGTDSFRTFIMACMKCYIQISKITKEQQQESDRNVTVTCVEGIQEQEV